MYELKKKKIGKVLTSKFVGTGTSSYEKRIYRAAVSQRMRNTGTYEDQFTFFTIKELILFSCSFTLQETKCLKPVSSS